MSRIRIEVRRDDDEVTRLEGPAGLAIMLQKNVQSVEGIPDTAEGAREWIKGVDPAVISLRAKEPEELVIMLATLIATVRAVTGPEIVAAAMLLAPYINADRPDFRRVLP